MEVQPCSTNPSYTLEEEHHDILIPIQMDFYSCYMQLLDFAETGSQSIIDNLSVNIDCIRNKLSSYEDSGPEGLEEAIQGFKKRLRNMERTLESKRKCVRA